MTTPNGSGVSRRAYLILGGGLVPVTAVAITLALVLRPSPLTGDVGADAACTAPASAAIAEIRRAGIALGARNAVGGIPLLGGSIGFMTGLDEFGAACARHGWTPEAAGLVDE